MSKRPFKYGRELQPGDPDHDTTLEVVQSMWDAIPQNATPVEIVGACSALMRLSFETYIAAKYRLGSFDEATALHRELIEEDLRKERH